MKTLLKQIEKEFKDVRLFNGLITLKIIEDCKDFYLAVNLNTDKSLLIDKSLIENSFDIKVFEEDILLNGKHYYVNELYSVQKRKDFYLKAIHKNRKVFQEFLNVDKYDLKLILDNLFKSDRNVKSIKELLKSVLAQQVSLKLLDYEIDRQEYNDRFIFQDTELMYIDKHFFYSLLIKDIFYCKELFGFKKSFIYEQRELLAAKLAKSKKYYKFYDILLKIKIMSYKT